MLRLCSCKLGRVGGLRGRASPSFCPCYSTLALVLCGARAVHPPKHGGSRPYTRKFVFPKVPSLCAQWEKRNLFIRAKSCSRKTGKYKCSVEQTRGSATVIPRRGGGGKRRGGGRGLFSNNSPYLRLRRSSAERCAGHHSIQKKTGPPPPRRLRFYKRSV